MIRERIMSFLFRKRVKAITPLDVKPAASPDLKAHQEGERGRNSIVQNVILAGQHLAKAQNNAAHSAAKELRGL